MYVNIEFLDTEPMENVITALHYKIDKTICVLLRLQLENRS